MKTNILAVLLTTAALLSPTAFADEKTSPKLELDVMCPIDFRVKKHPQIMECLTKKGTTFIQVLYWGAFDITYSAKYDKDSDAITVGEVHLTSKDNSQI